MRKRAFTILELLMVVGIIAVLAGILLPSLSKARENSRTLACLAHLREFGAAWANYATENEEVLMPARMYEKPGGASEPNNWYEVGNGFHYRPRWPAVLGGQLGIHAFKTGNLWHPPATQPVKNDRLDFVHDLYKCPAVPLWVDARNYAYGYNHLFLGNARQTSFVFHNFPVRRHKLVAASSTVVFADSMGTAAGFASGERGGYRNDSKEEHRKGNHAYTLDAPRLTDECDRGTGGIDSARSAVDPRHRGKLNAVFADGHGDTVTDRDLGYRRSRKDRYVDLDPAEDGALKPGDTTPKSLQFEMQLRQGSEDQQVEDAAHNRFFSGTGKDDDPPDLPKSVGK